jgi:hypothetical protein
MLMLRALLRTSPRDHKIACDAWSRALVAAAIERLFGHRYSLQHVGRIMRRIENETQPIPKVVHLELKDLLAGTNISRIRTHLQQRHGRN